MNRACLLWLVVVCGCTNDTTDIFQNASGAGGTKTSGTTSGSSTVGATSGTSSSTSSLGPSSTTNGSSSAAVGSTSSGGPMPVTYCNDNPCLPGEVCCYSNAVAGSDKCAADGSCLPGFVELKCNGPADCPGGECCGRWTVQAGWQYTQCKAKCETADRVMCFGDATVCKATQACIPSQALGQGYRFCG